MTVFIRYWNLPFCEIVGIPLLLIINFCHSRKFLWSQPINKHFSICSGSFEKPTFPIQDKNFQVIKKCNKNLCSLSFLAHNFSSGFSFIKRAQYSLGSLCPHHPYNTPCIINCITLWKKWMGHLLHTLELLGQ